MENATKSSRAVNGTARAATVSRVYCGNHTDTGNLCHTQTNNKHTSTENNQLYIRVVYEKDCCCCVSETKQRIV